MSAFPLPPAHFRLYTSDAVEKGTAPAPPALPGDDETYSVFGQQMQINAPLRTELSAQGIEQLYDAQADPAQELLKLNAQLLGCFQKLLGALVKCSEDERNEHMKRMELLFINMHHLLNDYRPHQARETIKAMLEMQARERNELTAELSSTIDSVLQKLSAAGAMTPPAGAEQASAGGATAMSEDSVATPAPNQAAAPAWGLSDAKTDEWLAAQLSA